jgi:hypothetical protein
MGAKSAFSQKCESDEKARSLAERKRAAKRAASALVKCQTCHEGLPVDRFGVNPNSFARHKHCRQCMEARQARAEVLKAAKAAEAAKERRREEEGKQRLATFLAAAERRFLAGRPLLLPDPKSLIRDWAYDLVLGGFPAQFPHCGSGSLVSGRRMRVRAQAGELPAYEAPAYAYAAYARRLPGQEPVPDVPGRALAPRWNSMWATPGAGLISASRSLSFGTLFKSV